MTSQVKIFGWQADDSGCGYYRIALPLHALADRGHKITYNERMPQELFEHPEQLDVVIAQRTCNPGPSGWWQKLARKDDRPMMVYELDDDLWQVDPSNKPAHAFYQADVLERLTDNVRVADLVTVSTEPLADVVSAINPNVRVLPNQVPAWLLEHQKPDSNELVTFGWRGGASHSRDFGEMAQPLRRFLQHPTNRGRVEMHCMGVDYTDRVRTTHGLARHTEWMPVCADFLKAVDFDVAVIPLRDCVFNDSKSELALLEMSALGIPAIVSNAGPYAATRMGPPRMIARTSKEWEPLLRHLADNVEDRARMGKAAREWVADRTVEANAWRWEEAYRG